MTRILVVLLSWFPRITKLRKRETIKPWRFVDTDRPRSMWMRNSQKGSKSWFSNSLQAHNTTIHWSCAILESTIIRGKNIDMTYIKHITSLINVKIKSQQIGVHVISNYPRTLDELASKARNWILPKIRQILGILRRKSSNSFDVRAPGLKGCGTKMLICMSKVNWIWIT